MKKILIGIILTISINVFSQNDFKMVTAPYVQALTDTQATIVWLTNKDAVSWVEIAPDDTMHFYLKERPKYFQTHIGKKVVGTTHAIVLNDLLPGTSYRYRIYSQEVIGGIGSATQYGKTIATKVLKTNPLKFKTLDTQTNSFSFVMVNDIHEKNDLLTNLLKNVKTEGVDFVIYNGDMVNDMRTPEKVINGFLTNSSELFASEIPFYMVRGNHETRGLAANTYMDFFPSTTGQPYYAFQQGNSFIIVLDSGEDKPDSDIEYGGLALFDAYRMDEAKWLKEVVSSSAFKSAKHKFVMIHMPPMPNHWHGPTMVKDLFVPILNEAGIDLMLSGHLHKHLYYENNYGGCQFPVLINSSTNKVRIDVSDNTILVKTINQEEKQEFKIELKKK